MNIVVGELREQSGNTNDGVLNYTTEGNLGLSDHQLTKLEGYVSEANANWNKVGESSTEYQGQFFTVEFNFHLMEVESSEQLQIINERILKGATGENIAARSKIEPVGVSEHYISVGKLEHGEPPFRGSHEMGHTIGLAHPADLHNDISTVMSYNMNRPPPTKKDVQNFLNKLDFNKQKQVIKGDKP